MDFWIDDVNTFVASLPFSATFQPEWSYHTWSFEQHRVAIVVVSLSSFDLTVYQNYLHYLSTTGLRPIVIWEDQWVTQNVIVKSRLKALFGLSHRIPARLTRVKRIDKATLESFILQNHLQVPTNAKFKYGLFLPNQHYPKVKVNQSLLQPNFLEQDHQETLVAVASFSGARNIVRDKQKYRSFELIRFCNLLHCTVIGGLDKLVQSFVKDTHPDDLMTYADAEWSQGDSYRKLGFEYVGQTASQWFWVNKYTYARQYVGRLPNVQLSPDWVRIPNQGSLKFLKKWK